MTSAIVVWTFAVLLFVLIVLICAISIWGQCQVTIQATAPPFPQHARLTWLFEGTRSTVCNVVMMVWALSALFVMKASVFLCMVWLQMNLLVIHLHIVCVYACAVFLWFSGHWHILVTGRTSEIYSRCSPQQPASNSSSSRGKECRLSGGLGRVKADPARGSGDDGSPVSWVVEERKRRKVGEGGVVLKLKRGGWRHLVWCQSSQLCGMLHSRRSTPRCFLSPPTHIHHPAAHLSLCTVFTFEQENQTWCGWSFAEREIPNVWLLSSV